MIVVYWLAFIIPDIYAQGNTQNKLDEAKEVLKKLSRIEVNRERPYEVDEIFEILKTEFNIDLEALLKEHSITKHDIENYRQSSNSIGFNGAGVGLTAFYEGDYDQEDSLFPGGPDEDIDIVRFGFSSLQSTSNSIMSMIFQLSGNNGNGGIPTPPPMPLFTTQAPARWGSWQSWTSCSATCGGGSRKRYRQCKRTNSKAECNGTHRQVGFCNTHSCPTNNIWLPWAAWGDCTRSCGTGQQIRRRRCSGSSCSGDSIQVQQCSNSNCNERGPNWNAWASWSNCSKTCASGYQYRLRTCSARQSDACPGKSREFQPCNMNVPCKKDMNLVWTEWSKCSTTCGEGVKTRTRTCEHSPAKCRRFQLKDTEKCFNSQPCGYWANWQGWGKCTVTCGLGVKSRIRKCVDGTSGKGGCQGSYEDITPCNTQVCPSWTNWQPWSACTETCGGGFQRRARYCMNGAFDACPGEPSEERTCQTDPCPRWTNWTEWSKCSKECGGGTTTITRECIHGKQGQRGCFGQSTITHACNKNDCATWADWGQFSLCTKTCGGGIMAQQRECRGGVAGIDCVGQFENIQPCNEKACPFWSSWSSWGDCTASCGRGVKARTRQCSEKDRCPGDNEDVDFCGGNECPSWTQWSDYSSCSKSCGGGLKQRSRACNAGYGQCGSESPYERVSCNEQACDEFGSWSNWSKCTEQCGGGYTSRSRDCDSGDCTGMGSSFQTGRCNTQECEYGDWSSWSACNARQCGAMGEKTRTRECNGNSCRGSRIDRTSCYEECDEGGNSVTTSAATPTTTANWIEAMQKEIDDARSTADPSLQYECTTLNVNGECLDHLDYTKDDNIVDVGTCNLPAFIIQNDQITGSAELITDTRVRYRCMDSYKLRGPKNIECKCKMGGKYCRQQPKKTPRCIKFKDNSNDDEHIFEFEHHDEASGSTAGEYEPENFQ